MTESKDIRARRRWARIVDEAMHAEPVGVQEVARRAKVGRSTIYRLLGLRPTNVTTRAAIAKALRIREKDLTT